MLARRLGLLAAGGAVVVIALVSGAVYLYFLLYLAVITVGMAYLVARRGLTALEAGSWPDRQQASVGDVLTITFTLRSMSRLPKPWLEVHRPSTLPQPIPGRVVSLGPRTSKTWAARVLLSERGQFRVDPMVIRCGDPLGLFESVASVGSGVSLIVHPVVSPLPAWNLPTASIEGTSARGEAGRHLTPLVTSVRPYTPGDAFNRIHWRSSARHQELQVKEFDIEPAADLWLFLDLERAAHKGAGTTSTIETAVRVVAAVTGDALREGRNVGLEAVGTRRIVLPPDRGPRQQQKILGLLAVAHAEGATPLAEMLVRGLSRPRRGTIALVVTPSLDASWIRPLAALRSGGATPIACVVDPLAHRRASTAETVEGLAITEDADLLERQLRGLVHALTEHDVEVFIIRPDRPLGEQLVSGRRSPLRTTA
jgi:uncharacterized protein (DUF58 family)